MKYVKSLVYKIRGDSLYRNALFLTASTFVMAGIGFFFWTICARYYTPEQIGLATTLISLTSLITSFSMFGLNTALIRFLPESKDKSRLVNTAFGVIIVGTVIVTLIVLGLLPWISPRLAFIRDYPLFETSLVVFMVVASLNGITDSVFIANRKTEYILAINTIMSLVKLATPILLVSWGTYGIFYGFMTSINVALVLSVLSLVVFFDYRFRPRIRLDDIRKMWRFASGTYAAGIIGMLNSTITPILITNTLGPAMTAYYFMPSMIILLVLSISRSLSSSMIAEGSHIERNIRSLLYRSLKASFITMAPLITAIYILGPYILAIFGKSYTTEGITYLRLALISIFVSIPVTFLGTIFTIKKRVDLILLFSVISAIVGILLTILFLPMGLRGLGIAGIIGQSIMLVLYSISLFSKRI